MPKHYVVVARMCEFYRYETSQTISCEGIIKGSVIHMGFASKIESRNHKKKYCDCEDNTCPIRSMLNKIYEV